jgi:hypothetical protein
VFLFSYAHIRVGEMNWCLRYAINTRIDTVQPFSCFEDRRLMPPLNCSRAPKGSIAAGWASSV